jgi:hypothetical protein
MTIAEFFRNYAEEFKAERDRYETRLKQLLAFNPDSQEIVNVKLYFKSNNLLFNIYKFCFETGQFLLKD